MVKKLPFLSTKSVELRLLRNAFLIGGVCFLAALFSFAWWATVLACIGAFIGYIFLPDRRVVRTSYWTFVICSTYVYSLSLVPGVSLRLGALVPILSFIGGVALLFLLQSLAHGVFHASAPLYAFMNTVFMFGLFLVPNITPWERGAGISVVIFLGTIFISALLLREAFLWYGVPLARARFISYAISVLLGELYLICSFLPLGPFNAAAFLTLAAFFVRDVFIASHRGTLSVPFVLRSLTFFALITIIILSSSPWSI